MNSAMSILARLGRRGLWLVPLAFLSVFFFYPLLSILWVSFTYEGTPGFGAILEVLRSAYFRNIFLFTLGQALISTGLTLILALPTAYVFARISFPGRNLLLSLTSLPFVLPTIVVATAFSALLGPRGLINDLLVSGLNLGAPPIQFERTLGAIVLVHVFYNFPLALRMIVGFWTNRSPQIEEAARVLGGHGWKIWWHIRLPFLRPILLASALLVFSFTFTSFGVVLVLGGPRFATLEVEIYRQVISYFNLPIAASLSLLQIGGIATLMLFYTRFQKQVSTELGQARVVAPPPRTRGQRIAVGLAVPFVTTLLFLPLLALFIRSISDQGEISFQYYVLLATTSRDSVLFVPPLQAIGNSLLFAIVTTIISVTLGLMTATLLADKTSTIGRWLDPLFMLPLATSAVTLGLGYVIALDEPPLNLRTSPAIIPIAHTLVAMPFVIRSILPALRGIPPDIREAARTLGAPTWQVWRLVDLPLISRNLIVGATFAFTVSMGEFGASMFVARPELPTLPIAIYRLLGQPGRSNYGQATALSVILLVVCAISFLLLERLRGSNAGEF